MPQNKTAKKFKAAARKPVCSMGPLLAPGYTAEAEKLFDACRAGDIKAVKKLLKEGADPNAEYVNGDGAIHYAIAGSHDGEKKALPLIKALITAGTDVNKPGCSSAALYDAAWRGHVKIAELLLDNGAKIDARGFHGATALAVAVEQNHAGMVRLLIDRGADTAVKNENGHSILRSAADGGKCGEALEVFLSYPAESQARRELLAAQKQAAAEATTVLEGKITVGKPLQLKKPASAGPV